LGRSPDAKERVSRMCQVCAKELYKERRRQDYASKRRKRGQLATRRLTPTEKKVVNLALWSRDFGNDPLEPSAHNDLG
jgi:hypothetical protein